MQTGISLGLVEAARRLGLSVNHLRYLTNIGALACFRDSASRRCFLPIDIEKFREKREQEKQQREAERELVKKKTNGKLRLRLRSKE